MNQQEAIDELRYLMMCDEKDNWTEVMEYAIDAIAHSACSAWRTDAPPRDGTRLLIRTLGGMLCIAWYNGQSNEWNTQVEMSEKLEERYIIAWASITPYKEGKA